MQTIYPKFVRVLLPFVAGLLIATACFEGFLRATENVLQFRFLPVAQMALYGPDFDAGYTLRPNLRGLWDTENRARIETSGLGYRGHDVDGGRADIVFAGNSLTEALQVEEEKTFVFLTGQYLGKKTVNLGLSGAPPAVIVSRLEKFLPILKPEMAVIPIDTRTFEKPDMFQDGAYAGYKIDADRSAARRSYAFRETRGYKIRTSVLGRIIYWGLDHFRIAALLNTSINRGLLDGLCAKRRAEPENRDAGMGTMQSFFDLWLRGDPRPNRLVLEAFLRDLAALQAENHVRIIIALNGPWKDEDSATLVAVNETLDEMTNRYGVIIENLTPFIQKHLPKNDGAIHLHGFRPPWQGHLNETGHMVYAGALAERIENQENMK